MTFVLLMAQLGMVLIVAMMLGQVAERLRLPAIVSHLGLLRTEVGQIILSAAVIDDLCGWLGFAVVVGAFTPSGREARPVWEVVLIVLGGFFLTLTVGRKLGSRVAQ